MSQSNIKLFLEKVQTDESLQMELKNMHDQNQQLQFEQFMKLGEESGFPFSKEEWQQYTQEVSASMQQNGELSDVELEAVAGGRHWSVGYFISVATATVGCIVSAAQTFIEESGDACFIENIGK